MLPISVGVTLGSLFVYGLTYFLGKPAIDRFGKFLGVSGGEIRSAEERFSKENRDGLLLFGVKTVPVIPSVVISAFCGTIKIDAKKNTCFIPFLGTLVRAFILGITGWQVGNIYQQYAGIFSTFENVILTLIVVGVVVYIYVKRRGISLSKVMMKNR